MIDLDFRIIDFLFVGALREVVIAVDVVIITAWIEQVARRQRISSQIFSAHWIEREVDNVSGKWRTRKGIEDSRKL